MSHTRRPAGGQLLSASSVSASRRSLPGSAEEDLAVADVVIEAAGDDLGSGLASGDLDGDGSNDLVVGAQGLMGSGGLYVEYAGR